jgi:hypothetical protein
MPSLEHDNLQFDSIEDCIAAFSTRKISHSTSHLLRAERIPPADNRLEQGEFLVVLDSQDRENEGDLIIAAEDMTTEKMAFMIRYSRSATPKHRLTCTWLTSIVVSSARL